MDVLSSHNVFNWGVEPNFSITSIHIHCQDIWKTKFKPSMNPCDNILASLYEYILGDPCPKFFDESLET